MSFPGLPPLPKSLSGLELATNQHNISSAFVSLENKRNANGDGVSGGIGGGGITTSTSNSKKSTLDTQLAILRREMVSVFLYIIYIVYETILIIYFIYMFYVIILTYIIYTSIYLYIYII